MLRVQNVRVYFTAERPLSEPDCTRTFVRGEPIKSTPLLSMDCTFKLGTERVPPAKENSDSPAKSPPGP